MKFSFLSAKGYLTLLVTLLGAIGQLYAQNSDAEITLSSKNITLAAIVEQVQAQTPFRFVYSKKFVAAEQPVSLQSARMKIDQLLFALNAKTGLRFERSGNQIVITQSDRGSISGTVRTSDNQPASNVTVTLKGLRTTHSDEDGTFIIKNIPAGNYRIEVSYVGYAAGGQQVEVKMNEQATVDFVISSSSKELSEVIVSGNKKNKFASKESEYVARMQLKNLENPQVYNVVTSELMKEQVVVTPVEAIRNATGAVPVIYPSGGFGVSFRGFSIGANARNGMETTTERSGIDVANIERIEVLKGPSGTLFGASASSFGGVVNVVTKKPFETSKSELSYTTGSFGLNRMTVDVNTPLNSDKTVLFRVNASVNREKSFLNYGFNNTTLIAPSLSYRANERLSLNFDAELLKFNNTQPLNHIVYPAANFKSAADIPLPYRSTLYHDDADAKGYTTKFFAVADYRLSDKWTSKTLFSFTGENVDYSYQRPVLWMSPTVATRAFSVYGPLYNNYTNIQENLTGEFATGTIQHKVLIGLNYRYYNGKFLTSNVDVIDQVDVTGKFAPVTKGTIDKLTEMENYPTADQHTASAYVSDVVNFTSRFSALLSLRVDHFERKAVDETDKGYKQTSLAPKLGLVYQLIDNKLSVFSNYMSGFQNSAPVNQPDGSRKVLDPIFARQFEGGIKAELFEKKLSATVSYYNIEINNATRTTAELLTVQDGKQQSKGAEVELIANPLEGLNIAVGYAYNNNRILKTDDPALDGNKAENSPNNVANFWVSYLFQDQLRGFGLGFGGNYVDRSFRLSDNLAYTPEYTLLNSTVFYDLEQWRIGAKFNNMTNKKYWDSQWNAQRPSNFAVNLTVRF